MKSFLFITVGILVIAMTQVYSAPEGRSMSKSQSLSSESPEKQVNRFQELFIWKVSEELKLSVKKEKEFSQLIRKTDREREQGRQKIESILLKMKNMKSDREAKALVDNYKSAWTSYYKTRDRELNDILKVLGPLKTAKYLVVRDKVTKGLKLILSEPSSQPKAPKTLAKPKIIEE